MFTIKSSIDERTLTERTEAAKAVLAHADQIADDSESHLRNIWGLSLSPRFPELKVSEHLRKHTPCPSCRQVWTIFRKESGALSMCRLRRLGERTTGKTSRIE